MSGEDTELYSILFRIINFPKKILMGDRPKFFLAPTPRVVHFHTDARKITQKVILTVIFTEAILKLIFK